MNSCCSRHGGAKDGSLWGKEHSEADGSSGVCSKCMLVMQRSNVEAAIIICIVFPLLTLWGRSRACPLAAEDCKLVLRYMIHGVCERSGRRPTMRLAEI